MTPISIQNYSPGGINRYSAKKTQKPINFVCLAPHARQVCIIGDFNDWQPASTPMRRHVDGSWQAQVILGHGHHRYLFLIDGVPALDPHAQGIARNEQNEKVSLLAVS